MPEPTQEDIKLLGILVSRGLVTPDQSNRVKRVLHTGMELIDALQTTPLVEPLQFMKAQQIHQAQDSAPKDPVERDDEGVNVMDLEVDSELDFESWKPTPVIPNTGEEIVEPTPEAAEMTDQAKLVESDFDLDEEDFHDIQTGPSAHPPVSLVDPDPEPEEPKYQRLDTDFDIELETPAVEVLEDALDDELELPGMSKEAVPKLDSAEVSKHAATQEPIALPRDSTGFIRPGVSAGVFDLANDEGIAVIGQANHLLIGVIQKKHAAVLLHQAGNDSRVDHVDSAGHVAETENMGPEAMSKIINRLKVMARIEPWRKTSLQGGFYMLDKGIEYTAIVESGSGENEETLQITIRPGRV
ncbi:hypothetical protein KQI84_09845 [bacterium]|nr:hypothetical protein [bacterium]